jgi:flagellum-specific peptidoglycan hydrolase FlgJ
MSTTTGRKPLNFGFIGLGIAAIGLLIVLIVFLIRRKKAKETVEEMTDIAEVKVSSSPDLATQKQIFAEIKNAALDEGANPNQAAVIAGISALETGRYKSELYVNYHNPFGMKDGGSGQGIQARAVKGFAVYDNWQDAVKDLVAWFAVKGFPINDNLDPEYVLNWLKSKKYFEAPLAQYKNSVLSLINEMEG